MNDIYLTQDEAEYMLNMLKRSLAETIQFPKSGDSTEFELEGSTARDLFVVNIYRGTKNNLKYDIGARVKINNILLLELHINPSNIHRNPTGEKICGSHWHIYTEKYGRRMAYPAESIESDKFVANTINFLKKFNVINIPLIQYQCEILK